MLTGCEENVKKEVRKQLDVIVIYIYFVYT